MLDLVYLYPPLLKTLLLAITLLIIPNFNSIITPFKTIKRRTWVVLLLIFILGLYLRLFAIPHTHQVYFDEFEHVNIAENILYSNKFCGCFIGSNQYCRGCGLMPWPPGYHTFLSLALGVFGDSEAVAYNTNAVIGSISILLVFLLLFLTFKDSTFALISAFMLSFIPVHLKYSGTSSMEIFSFFCIVLSMVFLEIYFRARKPLTFILFLATLLYAVQTRPENFLLLIPVTLYILLKEEKRLKQFFKKEYLIPLLLFLLLLIPLSQLIYYATSIAHAVSWDDPIPKKIGYIRDNLIPNIFFFFDSSFNSPLFMLICILGAADLYLTDKKRLIYYSSFFLIFLLMYSSFPGGNIDTYPSARYSLMLYIPLVVSLAAGINLILKNLHFNKSILIILIISAYLLTLLQTSDFIFSKYELDGEYEFILSMKDRLPSDLYILSYSPSAIIAPLHKYAVLDREFVDNWDTFEPKNNVIVFKDFWWYLDSNSNESARVEEELKKHYNSTLIAKSPEGYAFYNLTSR
jgi:4-amino-4-deoxy-L-arabinose transferase-like glycosyltransferase